MKNSTKAKAKDLIKRETKPLIYTGDHQINNEFHAGNNTN